MTFWRKLFGTGRGVHALRPFVGRASALEKEIARRPDIWFARRMRELRANLARLDDNARPLMLDAILPEVFAMTREAGRRTLMLRLYDVQLLGAAALHRGWIAEMKTGEGKTLAAVPAVCLNALAGSPVHVVTVNDYLASRDAEWMGPLYAFLGLTVGTLASDMEDACRREAYACDVVYGTNSEFGFDYLRDNMKTSIGDRVQRGLGFALVDEVDSILIDEARTPLVISGEASGEETLWRRTADLVAGLTADDWSLDEKLRTVSLTEQGTEKVERLLGVDNLFLPEHIRLQHHVLQSLRARVVFRRDVDYIVRDGEVLVVDEMTGRTLAGRRWSDGLHQAVEAKENVAVHPENRTEAAISFQNFFRLYDKLAGMTGTADSEAVEFKQIYGLEVADIPTNRPVIRMDQPDLVFLTAREKFAAVTEAVRQEHAKGRPVLVGTSSVEVSEALSRRFAREGLAHEVLNAKNPSGEAKIVALAGRHGRITVATSMAGRGTDIVLDDEARKAGGLAIIGTERTESRRTDDQLRGRSGRQGDPGSSRFYVSLEDPLPRLFGSVRLHGLLAAMGAGEGRPIESRQIARAVIKAQQKVEEMHFDTRKTLLDQDDALNRQREVVYALRREFMDPETVFDAASDAVEAFLDDLFGPEGREKKPTDEEKASLELREVFGALCLKACQPMSRARASGACHAAVEALRLVGGEYAADAFGRIFLKEIDAGWRSQLGDMEALRDGVGLRGYGNLDPKLEYKREAWNLFCGFLSRMRHNALRALMHIEFQPANNKMD